MGRTQYSFKHKNTQHNIKILQEHSREGHIQQPDVVKALKRANNRKATGSDNIEHSDGTIEIWMVGLETLADWLYNQC